MAEGPDPSRHFETDREMTRDQLEEGGGLGNPRSTRAGLSSWAIAALVLVLLALFLFLMR